MAGMTRLPITSIRPANSPSLPKVRPRLLASTIMLTSPPFSAAAMGGRITSTSTVSRSCTTSQPTAILPRPVSVRRRSCSARITTTVEATDKQRPNTSPWPQGQPKNSPAPMPSPTMPTICRKAPGSTVFFTSRRSRGLKCRPTPNISSTTPISASCRVRCWSIITPGLNGPTTTPASRYPTSGGSFRRWAAVPSTNARPMPMTSTAMSGECSMPPL